MQFTKEAIQYLEAIQKDGLIKRYGVDFEKHLSDNDEYDFKSYLQSNINISREEKAFFVEYPPDQIHLFIEKIPL
jgi:hypothetical protein